VGLKKLFLPLLFFLAHSGYSQPAIEKYDVEVYVDKAINETHVVEHISIAAWNNSLMHLQALPFTDIEFSNLKLKFEDFESSFTLASNANQLLESNLMVEQVSREMAEIEVSYTVRNANAMIRVPLIFLPLTPKSTQDDLFRATIHIPLEFELVDSFPTVIDDSRKAASGNVYEVLLPVIPSMLRLDVAKTSKGRVGTTEILDAFVIGVLLFLGIIGWRKRKSLV